MFVSHRHVLEKNQLQKKWTVINLYNHIIRLYIY